MAVVGVSDHPHVLVRASADGTLPLADREMVGLVLGQRGGEPARADLAFVLAEREEPRALLVIPLGFRLDDDLPSVREGYLVAVSVVAAVELSGFPAVESSLRDAEIGSESKALDLERTADKLLRHC